MDLANRIALGALICGGIQSLDVVFRWVKGSQMEISARLEHQLVPVRPTQIRLGLLTLSAITTIIFGCWIVFAKPLAPHIIEKTVFVPVEKPIPCPPSKTGNVRVGGRENIGNSGSGAHINEQKEK